MKNSQFSVVFHPESVEAVLKKSNCVIRPEKESVGELRQIDLEQLCGPAMEESALTDLVSRLPDCLADNASVFPINVPHGTPAIILHLAIRYCMMKCSCYRCNTMKLENEWYVGNAVSSAPELERKQTGHKFIGDQYPPALVNANDLRSKPQVQWLMQFLSTKAMDYLLNTLSFEIHGDGNAYPLLQDIFDMCLVSGTPEDNELCFSSTHIRFFWDDKINQGKRKRSVL